MNLLISLIINLFTFHNYTNIMMYYSTIQFSFVNYALKSEEEKIFWRSKHSVAEMIECLYYFDHKKEVR
jgi:hypothetical protein